MVGLDVENNRVVAGREEDLLAQDLEVGEINAFRPLVEVARDSGVHRFIYASSSSVYGVKEEKEVTEDLPLEP